MAQKRSKIFMKLQEHATEIIVKNSTHRASVVPQQ